jgi:hypothetical protein
MVGNHKVGCGEHKLTGLPRAIFPNMRVVLGLLKGAVVGGALGWAAFKLGIAGGAAAFATYAVIGGLVGMVCGKPPWRQDTFWTSALKGLFGLAVGAGLYWVGRKLLGGVHIALPAALGAPPDRSFAELPILLGPLVGALWGGFVEVDDGGSAAADKNKPKAAA